MNEENSEEGEKCPICVNYFEENEMIKCDRCDQQLCEYCFAKWKKSCPFCNKQYEADEENQNTSLLSETLHEPPRCKCSEFWLGIFVIVIFYITFFLTPNQFIYNKPPLTNSTLPTNSSLLNIYQPG